MHRPTRSTSVGGPCPRSPGLEWGQGGHSPRAREGGREGHAVGGAGRWPGHRERPRPSQTQKSPAGRATGPPAWRMAGANGVCGGKGECIESLAMGKTAQGLFGTNPGTAVFRDQGILPHPHAALQEAPGFGATLGPQTSCTESSPGESPPSPPSPPTGGVDDLQAPKMCHAPPAGVAALVHYLPSACRAPEAGGRV